MGIFSKKGKPNATAADTESISSKVSRTTTNTTSMQSPPNKPTNGFSQLASHSTTNVTLPPPPDPNVEPAAYLKSVYAVRERSKLVHDKAKRNQLNHFDVDLSKFSETAAYVVSITKV